MAIPKYSVIIPTLNGAETLSVTLPEMLKIDRDDIEWVISNNRSDDETKELLLSISDPRVRVVEPPERLPLGRHLEFAYLQAKGEWQGHLGDDDMLFPSRFEVLDHIIDDYQTSVICGDDARYVWPNHYDKKRCNTLDRRTYDNRIIEESGVSVAKKLLNRVLIDGGGSWVVRRSIIDQVRDRCGFFASPDHMEFFAMRAACAISPKVLKVNLPIFVTGRHNKSAGDRGLGEKKYSINNSWDLKFEQPNPWQYCPFQWKGYSPLSLDAALAVRNYFPELLGKEKIDWLSWISSLHSDFENLIRNGQIDPANVSLFSEGLRKLPLDIQVQWKLKLHLVYLIFSLLKRGMRLFKQNRYPNALKIQEIERFGWPDTLVGEQVGIQNIVDVPKWVEKTFPGYFPKKA